MAVGDIGAVIDSLVCNALASRFPTVAHVAGDIYVICCDNGGVDGWIYTVQIASDGQIPATIEDSNRFRTTQCDRPRIIKVAPNIFALVCQGPGDLGILNTRHIDNAGNITTPSSSYLVFDAIDCTHPEICEITDNYFVIAYRYNTNDFKITTVHIDDAGAITDPVEDSWQLVAGEYYDIDVIKIAPNVLAFFSRDFLKDGWVQTVAISDVGTISKSFIDQLEYEVGKLIRPFGIHVYGNVWASINQDDLDDGYIHTMEILTDGQIGAAQIDRLEYDTLEATYPTVVAVGAKIFAIAAESGAASIEISTIQIENNGDIAASCTDNLDLLTTYLGHPWIFHVTGNIFAIAHKTTSDYLAVTTFDITTLLGAQNLPLLGVG